MKPILFFARFLPGCSVNNTAILQRIAQLENTIMSAISNFAAAVNSHNDQVDDAIDGITGDLKTLNDTITKLQSTSGAITPEDQALLDNIQARSQGIADKIAALDAITPPAAP